MVKALAFKDATAFLVFSAFTALLLATPVLGGYIADRVLSAKSAVILGAILLSGGYFILSMAGIKLFYCALALLICGNGLLKPNISSLLGSCYKTGDARRGNHGVFMNT